jgi:hypothetical protein
MTVHIAFASAQGAVVVSDSQGTFGLESEHHGLQKQYIGEDFVVCVAGDVSILNWVFESLGTHGAPLNASNICATVEQILEVDVRPQFQSQVAVMVLTSDTTESQIRLYDPARYRRFGPASSFNAIGSGATFVDRAMRRDTHLGIRESRLSLADMLAGATSFADVANESLAVDDLLLAGILAQGRSYILGDRKVVPARAPAPIKGQWTHVSAAWSDIQAICAKLNSEIREATRIFSVIRDGHLDHAVVKNLMSANASIATARGELTSRVADFRRWYDSQLGRK